MYMYMYMYMYIALGSSENQMFKQISRGSIKKYSGATKKQETGRNDSSKCELPKDQPQMLNMFFEYLLDPSSFCIDMKKQDMFMSTYVYVHVYVNTQMYNVQVYVEGFTCYIYVLIYKLYGIQLDNYIYLFCTALPLVAWQLTIPQAILAPASPYSLCIHSS